MCRRVLVLGLAAGLLSQCQSGPKRVLEVHQGEPVRISLGNRQGLMMEMLNSSSVRSEQADELRQKRPGLKIVADSEIQNMLDVLGHQGFFDNARPQADRLARSWIVVERGNRRWVGSGVGHGRTKEEMVAQAQRYASWVEAVRIFYNRTENFTSAQLREAELKRSSEQVNQSSREIRSKKQGENRNP